MTASAIETASPPLHSKVPTERLDWTQLICSQLRLFFFGRDSALNLAIVRIFVLATILTQLDFPTLMWIARLPPELQLMPPGAMHIVRVIPVNETTAAASIVVCAVACIFGIVGLFSRTACAIAALSGVYALLLGHLVTIAPHNQHLIWFSAILASSRCGDSLSIDSIIGALQRARHGVCTRINRSRSYAIPLRFIWILFGIVYLFPGYWKLTRGYSEWVAGHALIKALHYKWALYGGWVAPLRIDQAPGLCKLLQFATISFELVFIVAILFPVSRQIAAGAGLFFHNATAIFMRVSFFWLQTCYVALIDWHALALRIGKSRRKPNSIVSFDSACCGCRKSVALLRQLDLCRTHIFTSAKNCNTSASINLHHWLQSAKYKQPYSSGIPIPFRLCRKALWQLLRSMHQKPEQHRLLSNDTSSTNANTNDLPVLILGTLLVLMSIRAGSLMNDFSWPFACYPEYIIRDEHIERLAISLVGADGKRQDIELAKEMTFLTKHINRQWPYVWPPGRGLRPQYRIPILRATWNVLKQSHPEWEQASTVRFLEESFSTDPDLFQRGPNSKKLIYEMQLHKANTETGR